MKNRYSDFNTLWGVSFPVGHQSSLQTTEWNKGADKNTPFVPSTCTGGAANEEKCQKSVGLAGNGA